MKYIAFAFAFLVETVWSTTSIKDTIYIYNDEGSSRSCVTNFRESINSVTDYKVEEISAESIRNGGWRENAIAFVLPGGFDLPYCKKLNGAGNVQIKAFVEAGGFFIGSCAGAYNSASYCDFHRGDLRGYEVLGERELGFFSGAAVGPVLATYDYQSEEGARIAEVLWSEGEDAGKTYNVYYNGGCHFPKADECGNVTILGQYMNDGFERLAVIIECKVGEGKALLSGVHPEFSRERLEDEFPDTKSFNYQHLNAHIFPKLSDGSHMSLFRMLMERLISPK